MNSSVDRRRAATGGARRPRPWRARRDPGAPCARPAVTRRLSTPSLVHGIHESEPVHEHPDRPHHAGPACIDGVRGRGDVVASGHGHVGDDRVHRRFRIQAAQADDLVADVAGLDRAAAGAVDAQESRPRCPNPRRPACSPATTWSALVSPSSAIIPRTSTRALWGPPGSGTEPSRVHPEHRDGHRERESRRTGRPGSSGACGAARRAT